MTFVYRILFVDDEERLRLTTKAILESQGYDVLCAKDGLDGLAVLKEPLPDLVISDLQMPNMNGFEFLSVIRERFPQLPVIAVSGEFSGDNVPQGVLADAFFEKSQYTPDQLIARIADLVRRVPFRSSVKKPNTRVRIAPEEEVMSRCRG
jgi:CheY-like chemotaxis protein